MFDKSESAPAIADVCQPHTGHRKGMMSILRMLWRPVSWAVETKRAKYSAVLGIRIFVESRLEGRLIVNTTVRFLDHLVCSFIWEARAYYNYYFLPAA